MSLWSGVDTVAVASHGVYTETYGSGDKSNIANLFASFGYLEDLPIETKKVGRGTLNLSVRIGA